MYAKIVLSKNKSKRTKKDKKFKRETMKTTDEVFKTICKNLRANEQAEREKYL